MTDTADEGAASGPGATRSTAAGSLVGNPWAWLVLLAVYVGLGVVVKSAVLNWIVGPLFPLLFLHLVPTALARRRPA